MKDEDSGKRKVWPHSFHSPTSNSTILFHLSSLIFQLKKV